MPKVYLYKRAEGIPDSFLVNLFLSPEKEYGPLFQVVSTSPFKQMVDFVDSPKEADFMMLPHTYVTLERKAPTYISEAEDFAQANNLKTIIFAYGDAHTNISFKNSIIFRTAKYKKTLQKNEIIIPPFIEDLGEQFGVNPLSKTQIPIIGFAGMVNLPSIKANFKYKAKLLLAFVNELLGTKNKYERLGLHFRRSVISILSKTDKCDLRTQKRKTFSAAKSTIQGDPKVLRKEFVGSIKESHLPLVVRGDGNYSLRFYEVLSLGRVPLFIDTNIPLPLEDEIDYDSFMLRVDYKDINRLPEIISEFWNKTSNKQFLEMQRKARHIFETKLDTKMFYKRIFSDLK